MVSGGKGRDAVMRIERLAFQAFGPYVERQELNLEDLAKHRLFLIRGATGAGKTVILDAITYALYGKSSGGERGDLEAMRSRLAPDTLPTTVELICFIHGKRYRFYREVRVGKKRNGESSYKVIVNGGELRNGEFYPFFENCRASALEKQAEQLIGFTHAQFIRTIMLPQGKFERLLVSNSAEKQDILKTLFQSERWSLLCDTMSMQLKQDKEALDLLQQQRTELLVQGNVSTWEELSEQCQSLQAQEQMEKRLTQEEKGRWEAERNRYDEQVTLHQWAQRLAANRRQLSALKEQLPLIEQMREQVQIAEAYQQVLPYVRAWQEESLALQEMNRHKAESYQAKLDCEERWSKLQKQQEEWVIKKAWKQKAEQQLSQCEEQLQRCQQRRELEANINDLQKQADQIRCRQSTMDQQIEAVNRQEQQVRTAEDHLNKSQIHYLQWLKEEQLWRERKEAQANKQNSEQQLRDWNHQITAREALLAQAAAAEQAAREIHERLYQEYLSDSAALLSSLLKDGEPCPICGSREHPLRQEARMQMVENHRLQEAKTTWEQCQTEMRSHQMWLDQAMIRQKELREQLERQQTQVTALGVLYSRTAHEQLQQQIHKAQQEQEQLARERAALQQKLVLRQSWLEQKAQWQEQEQECRQQITILATRLQERFDQITETEEALEQKVNQQRAALQVLQKEYDTWKSAWEQVQIELTKRQSSYQHYERQWQRQQEKVQQRKAQLEQKNTAGLDLNGTFPEAAKIIRMKEKITAYELAFERCQGAIHECEEPLQGKKLADLDVLKQQYEEREQAYQQHFQRQLELGKQRELLEHLQKRYQKVANRYETSLLRFNKRSEFVKALRGDMGIGIERYVLGIMLSHITQTANALLRHVHDGRYAIYRSDEATGRKRKCGLELSIYDSHSCSLRSVVSLSGGEKFLVSLALSLALSTVVQARSGGVEMETMFIDEGFGSLDEQSIADALQLLQHMTAGKGWIAIISHVELLKENIPYGIEVCKHKEGSRCRMLI